METTDKVEFTVKSEKAQTWYISHPKYSYGIFCFNDSGDLFLNSDWGMYGFAWRSFGEDFKEFLSGTNAGYIVGKFDSNIRYIKSSGMPKHCVKPVTELVNAFIQALKEQNL